MAHPRFSSRRSLQRAKLRDSLATPALPMELHLRGGGRVGERGCGAIGLGGERAGDMRLKGERLKGEAGAGAW